MKRFGNAKFARCASAVLGLLAFTAGPARAAAVPRQVIAFYYDWYATPAVSGHWVHWKRNPDTPGSADMITDTPVGGPYDSRDPKVVNRQMQTIRGAGITALAISWWGQGNITDLNLDVVIPAAERQGLKYAFFYETLPAPATVGGKTGADAAVADLTYLLKRHSGDRGWLRADGKPVIFVYRRAIQELTPAGWQAVRARLAAAGTPVALIADTSLGVPVAPIEAAFDGVHSYSDADRTFGKSAQWITDWSTAADRTAVQRWKPLIVGIAVFPGFDNRIATGQAGSPRFIARNGTGTLDILGNAVLAAKPDWLLVTTWNEWHEGSEIEPSVQYGTAALDDIRRLSKAFLSGQ